MKISIIGTGNLATHLCRAWAGSSVELRQLVGRSPGKTERLAALSGAEPLTDFRHFDASVAAVLLAVADDAIEEVAQALAAHFGSLEQQPVVAHVSGATPLAIFQSTGLPHFGVFWPLQSFRSGKEVDFRSVPVCINASDEKAFETLFLLANNLSGQVCKVSEEQRQLLHLAAVFVNNFTNHLLAISKELTDEAGLPFDLLKPLLQETIDRLDTGQPHELQTGPAIRGDLKTIERHLHLLAAHPEYRQLYALLSQSIAGFGRQVNSHD